MWRTDEFPHWRAWMNFKNWILDDQFAILSSGHKMLVQNIQNCLWDKPCWKWVFLLCMKEEGKEEEDEEEDNEEEEMKKNKTVSDAMAETFAYAIIWQCKKNEKIKNYINCRNTTTKNKDEISLEINRTVKQDIYNLDRLGLAATSMVNTLLPLVAGVWSLSGGPVRLLMTRASLKSPSTRGEAT